ncbi:unnamed protein product [Didymodactylos carnosus]|uniref:Uncharacterized protein n=1 Tax=Didymodactylos carnosus TaxID=1234261 RepID=A0A813WSM4_9BILA|nr:unnamed protein product [Didymodactylos carnosus]CAF1211609.1 unnamed protein product [Didymodactylos carnosus]CAF3647683.1 unnamed protein product [Didymodactylos carnosus]CAF4020485.1 unnamed protein product [Didymodactylos carnosus]
MTLCRHFTSISLSYPFSRRRKRRQAGFVPSVQMDKILQSQPMMPPPMLLPPILESTIISPNDVNTKDSVNRVEETVRHFDIPNGEGIQKVEKTIAQDPLGTLSDSYPPSEQVVGTKNEVNMIKKTPGEHILTTSRFVQEREPNSVTTSEFIERQPEQRPQKRVNEESKTAGQDIANTAMTAASEQLGPQYPLMPAIYPSSYNSLPFYSIQYAPYYPNNAYTYYSPYDPANTNVDKKQGRMKNEGV